MTRAEFQSKIEAGSDIEFEINGYGYTVCTWTDDGISIGEWNRPETVSSFKTVEEMIDHYDIHGRLLSEVVGRARITDYTARS